MANRTSADTFRIFPWSKMSSFSVMTALKIGGVLIFLITLMFICCAMRAKERNIPVSPWAKTDRIHHYRVRARKRTDQYIYLKFIDGKWIHSTHSIQCSA